MPPKIAKQFVQTMEELDPIPMEDGPNVAVINKRLHFNRKWLAEASVERRASLLMGELAELLRRHREAQRKAAEPSDRYYFGRLECTLLAACIDFTLEHYGSATSASGFSHRNAFDGVENYRALLAGIRKTLLDE